MADMNEDGSIEFRGMNIPKGADYTRQEMWEWEEQNEDDTVSAHRLTYDVEVTHAIEEEGDPDESS